MVTTAVPLLAREKEAMIETIEEITGKRVELAEEIDPRIIAGAVVTYSGRMIDGSMATMLARMRERLMAARVA